MKVENQGQEEVFAWMYGQGQQEREGKIICFLYFDQFWTLQEAHHAQNSAHVWDKMKKTTPKLFQFKQVLPSWYIILHSILQIE